MSGNVAISCPQCGLSLVTDTTVAQLTLPTAEDPHFGVSGELPVMVRVVALLRAALQCLDHMSANPNTLTAQEAEESSRRLTRTYARLHLLREQDPNLWTMVQTMTDGLAQEVTKASTMQLFTDLHKLFATKPFPTDQDPL